MARYSFDDKPTATYKGRMSGSADSFSIPGCLPINNAETVKTRLDRLFAIVEGGTVDMRSMTRVRNAEVVDNG